MFIITKPELASKYDLGNDEIITNLDDFLTNCVLGIIEPQKIVIDETNDEACSELEDMGFEIILLHSYLKYKKPIEEPKVETNLFSEPVQEDDKAIHEEMHNLTPIKLPEKKEPEPMQEKKQGFFSKLFGNKKHTEEKKQVVIDNSFIQFNQRLKDTDQRGYKVKNYCKEHNLLTDDQIQKINVLMEQAETFGEHKRFVQTARDAKFLTEDQAAMVLSHVTSKEVVSKSKCNIERIYPLNSEMLSLLTDFFIYKIDRENKIVYICKDCSDEPKLHLLERRFMNYEVVVYNVIEGVTKEVLNELKGRANNG
jgi:hypothetical protein